MKLLLFVVLILSAAVPPAEGHGWMTYPVPLSGGTGTGTASTSGPCGAARAGPYTAAATFTPGQTVTIQYKRANSHGATGNTVNVRIQSTASLTLPANNAFFTTNPKATALALPMDVTVSGPQSASVTMPTTAGSYVMQWIWTPTSGGNWYDCAFIQIASGSVCATNNGGCSSDALCTGTTTATCTCKNGFFGNGQVCKPLPAPVPMEVTLKGTSVVQDTFASQVAQRLGVPVARVDYDMATNTSTTVTVIFTVLADPVSGDSAESICQQLFYSIVRGDADVAGAFGVPIVSVKYAGSTAAFGSDPNAGLSSENKAGKWAALSIGLILGVGIIALVFYVVRTEMRRGSSGSSKNAKTAATMPTRQQQQAASKPYRYVVQPSFVEPPPTSGLVDWTEELDDSGNVYYFNHQTGQSQWTPPAGWPVRA